MGRPFERPEGWPTNAMALLEVDGRAVFVTVHAARRWADRVRNDPRRRLKELAPDLRRIAEACGEWSLSPPPWWTPPVEGVEGLEGWLLFGLDIAMPVREGVAVTTMVRGTLHPESRNWRRKQRQARAAARRAISKGGGRGAQYQDKFRSTRHYKADS